MTKKHSTGLCNATLQITRHQYRKFAEVTKAFGMGLNLSTAERMGCWGSYSPWALLVCKDASDPHANWAERSLITLASSINADKFRAAGAKRPELNWAALEDDEIYPFVVWHEIGHRIDNFDSLGVLTMNDSAVRDKCSLHMEFLNEVLADRYAWERVRPGEPVPLSEMGTIQKEKTAEAMEYMNTHAPRMSRFKLRPLEPGHYKDVPDYMLASNERAAFIGPKVDKQLVHERAEYHHKRIEGGRHPLY